MKTIDKQPMIFVQVVIGLLAVIASFASGWIARGFLNQEKLRVWFAPDDIQAGKYIHEKIDRAIQIHDRLLSG